LDFGSVRVFVEADAPRVSCLVHGVLVAQVPWARAGSWFTREFEAQVAWLVLHACRSAVAELMRVDWKSVGGIVKRVYDDLDRQAPSRFDGLVRIGIDETSYRKGHKYLTIVVDHDRNRVVWVGIGYGRQVLEQFFRLLSVEQRAMIRVVSADGARWIADCVTKFCSNAQRTLDTFHAVAWVTETLDEVRRESWRKTRNEPQPKRLRGRPSKDTEVVVSPVKTIRQVRYSLLKNPQNLTSVQQARLDLIALENPTLYRAYKLKETFRLLLKLPLEEATTELNHWLNWVQRCRIKAFVELGRKIKRHKQALLDTIRLGLTNARIEATNNKIKLIIRTGYGFRNLNNLTALIMLKCSNHNTTLPRHT
jgi:transposase